MYSCTASDGTIDLRSLVGVDEGLDFSDFVFLAFDWRLHGDRTLVKNVPDKKSKKNVSEAIETA